MTPQPFTRTPSSFRMVRLLLFSAPRRGFGFSRQSAYMGHNGKDCGPARTGPRRDVAPGPDVGCQRFARVLSPTALIGFGFAIVQFFERLQQSPEARSAYLPDAPIYLGMALIACGVLALVVSIWQYRWTVRYLWGESFAPIVGMAREPMNSPVLAV